MRVFQTNKHQKAKTQAEIRSKSFRQLEKENRIFEGYTFGDENNCCENVSDVLFETFFRKFPPLQS